MFVLGLLKTEDKRFQFRNWSPWSFPFIKHFSDNRHRPHKWPLLPHISSTWWSRATMDLRCFASYSLEYISSSSSSSNSKTTSRTTKTCTLVLLNIATKQTDKQTEMSAWLNGYALASHQCHSGFTCAVVCGQYVWLVCFLRVFRSLPSETPEPPRSVAVREIFSFYNWYFSHCKIRFKHNKNPAGHESQLCKTSYQPTHVYYMRTSVIDGLTNKRPDVSQTENFPPMGR